MKRCRDEDHPMWLGSAVCFVLLRDLMQCVGFLALFFTLGVFVLLFSVEFIHCFLYPGERIGTVLLEGLICRSSLGFVAARLRLSSVRRVVPQGRDGESDSDEERR